MAKPRKTDVSPISRRKFIQGAVAASAAAGAAALPAKAHGGTSPAPMPDAPHLVGAGEEARAYEVLTPGQGRVLAAVLNRIIPATDVMTGAGDVGIARFIDGVLVDAPHLRRHVVAVLDGADVRGGFAALSEAEQDARLQQMARHRQESFNAVLQAAYTGYYSEPQVLAAIGWGPRPNSPGPAEPFDLRRLDAVRKRGPIYREVSMASKTGPDHAIRFDGGPSWD